jgi:uncharacterized RDD family membrane protein YckC
MGSALLDDAATVTLEVAEPSRQTAELSRLQSEDRAASELRRQAAERVAAHRSRRMGAESLGSPVISQAPRNARSAKIAAAVAERYAQTQTYNDFLAAEAERVVQQAHAAAEVAARNAQALATAQQRLLDAMEQQQSEIAEELHAREQPAESLTQIGQESSAASLLWPELEAEAEPVANRRAFRPPQTRAKQARRGPAAESEATGAISSAQTLADGITIRLYQDESGATRVALDPPAAHSISLPAGRVAVGAQSDEEARLLDEEIEFRHEPVFEEPAGPAEPLPANLIEFPRQLVAARKARPRLAEGPLREEAETAPGAGQLRIFEVEPEQIAIAPQADAEAEGSHTAQWSSILLESRPRVEASGFAAVMSEGEAHAAVKPQARASQSLKDVASIRRRIAALAINGAIVATAFAGFAAVFLWIMEHTTLSGTGTFSRAAGLFAGWQAIAAALPFAAGAFGLMAAVYQALFFTFSTATPGMRAARIALCTFSDENPTRTAVRRRLPALLLSALPMGFGFLWAALDEERLTWHDRICGIYQRSY